MWNKLWNAIADLEQLLMPSKLCWFPNRLVHASCVCPGLCWTLENFFFREFQKCSCWWGMFILQKTAEPWLLKRSWVRTDVFTECGKRVAARSFSCEQSNSEFLDRWAVFFVLHPFSCQMPTAVEQFENDCWSCFNWLKLYNLQPGWDVSNLLIFFSTDERCYSSLYQKQILIVVMLIWISLCRQKCTELLETEDLNVTYKISFKWDTLSHQSIKLKRAW